MRDMRGKPTTHIISVSLSGGIQNSPTASPRLGGGVWAVCNHARHFDHAHQSRCPPPGHLRPGRPGSGGRTADGPPWVLGVQLAGPPRRGRPGRWPQPWRPGRRGPGPQPAACPPGRPGGTPHGFAAALGGAKERRNRQGFGVLEIRPGANPWCCPGDLAAARVAPRGNAAGRRGVLARGSAQGVRDEAGQPAGHRAPIEDRPPCDLLGMGNRDGGTLPSPTP